MYEKLGVYGVSRGVLEFVDLARNGDVIPVFPLDAGLLDQARGDLLEAVEALKAASVDWKHRGDDEKEDVLHRLRTGGRKLLTALSGGLGRERLVEILSSSPHLVCRSDRHLPWEFLYLGPEDGLVDLGGFLGARAVIGRPHQTSTAINRARPSSPLVRRGPLAQWPSGEPIIVGYAEDDRLESARSGLERSIFSDLGLEILDLGKLKADAASSHEKLSEFMAASEVLTHFNSHAEEACRSKDGALYVSQDYRIDRAGIERLDVCGGSIVVLNCCSSHTMRHDVTDTLATMFMQKDAATVVATTAGIDDPCATTWARHFYAALRSGLSVPQSILKARRHLLEGRSANPLTMLYTYLGRDDVGLPAAGGAP